MGGFLGINQSKNASSSASNVSNTDSNNDDSYGSHNSDSSTNAGGNVNHFDSAYDSHANTTVTAGAGSTIVETDGGAVAGALDLLKSVLGGSGGSAKDTAHETAYDAGSAPSTFATIPTWAKVAAGVGVLVVVGLVVVVVMKRK